MKDYQEHEEEVEALIVSTSNSNSHDASGEPPSRITNLCLALLGLMATVLVSSGGFLWSRSWHSPSVTISKASNHAHRSNHTHSHSKGTNYSTGDFSANLDHDAIIKAQQIENFRNGNGLMINFHITHHGGTTFCGQVGRHLKSPSFACLNPRPPQVVGDDYPGKRPWSHEDTAQNIAAVTKYFNMISWEWKGPPKSRDPQIPDTDWENPNLVSVYVTREPISRLLAGDGNVKKKYPHVHTETNGTLEEWMDFAHDNKHTNNYALNILAGDKCCNGSSTDPIHLEHAKELVSRFTYVLDISCLDAGMQAMVDELGLNITVEEPPRTVRKHHHKPVSERIPYPEVYEYLRERNKLDIELYEWTKSRSLVDCSSL